MADRTIVFWNLARLFGSGGSPIEHALTMDDPDARSTAAHVQRKTRVIAAAIDQIAAAHGTPLIVGLVEIESSELAGQIADAITCVDLVDIDSQSRDETGISLDGLNITLLYDPQVFDGAVRLRSHLVDQAFGTRDILEAELGFSDDHDPVTAYVHHWPSRLASDGAARRIAAAYYSAGLVTGKVRFSLGEMWDEQHNSMGAPTTPDALRRARVPVIVMGDFNDEVFDDSLAVLDSTPDVDTVVDDLNLKGRSKRERFRTYRGSPPRLLNPFWDVVGHGGSYYRSPRWRTYDQILLSRGAVEVYKHNPLTFQQGSARVHNSSAVTLDDGSEFTLTNRGGKPIQFDPDKDRGCSDHFPVLVVVRTPPEGDA